jgi:ADP-heptose:LPS heptosyltransferase
VVLTEPPARILVIQLQQIGDTVIFTPTMRALRQRFPAATIDLLATPVAAQVYRKSPHVNDIHVTNKWPAGFKDTRIRRLLPLLRELRSKNYDCTIADLTEQSFKYTVITWLVGSPVRIGFDVGGRGFLHTMRLPLREAANWVDANLDIVRALGGEPSSFHEEVAFDAADMAKVRGLLVERGHVDGHPLVVMHTGANWQSRTWYHDRWAALADELSRRYGATTAFVGAAGESTYIESIRALMSSPSISLAGATDIPQLSALCSIANLFVGTDSGPRQIARAAGCAHVVVMCAQDDTDQWAGWGRGEVILRSFPPCHGCYFPHCAHKTCMDAIDMERVLAWCDAALADAQARHTPPRQDHVEIPPRLQPFAARGKRVLRALAHAPIRPT